MSSKYKTENVRKLVVMVSDALAPVFGEGDYSPVTVTKRLDAIAYHFLGDEDLISGEMDQKRKDKVCVLEDCLRGWEKYAEQLCDDPGFIAERDDGFGKQCAVNVFMAHILFHYIDSRDKTIFNKDE